MRLYLISAPVEAYQRWHAFGEATGWNSPDGPAPLPGTDIVVDVCQGPPRVLAGRDYGATFAEDAWMHDDWEMLPAIPFAEVLREAGLSPTLRLPAVLEDDRAETLEEKINDMVARWPLPVLVDSEGRPKNNQSRTRSNALRRTALMQSDGTCSCCRVDYARVLPDGAGMKALQVHHLKPLAGADPDAGAVTTVDDLVVVCASCHVLLHRSHPDGQLYTPEQLRDLHASVPAIIYTG